LWYSITYKGKLLVWFSKSEKKYINFILRTTGLLYNVYQISSENYSIQFNVKLIADVLACGQGFLALLKPNLWYLAYIP
jgi:hypothetical protein